MRAREKIKWNNSLESFFPLHNSLYKCGFIFVSFLAPGWKCDFWQYLFRISPASLLTHPSNCSVSFLWKDTWMIVLSTRRYLLTVFFFPSWSERLTLWKTRNRCRPFLLWLKVVIRYSGSADSLYYWWATCHIMLNISNIINFNYLHFVACIT